MLRRGAGRSDRRMREFLRFRRCFDRDSIIRALYVGEDGMEPKTELHEVELRTWCRNVTSDRGTRAI